MSKRHTIAVAIALGLIIGPSASVWAQDPIHKMGRGVVNVLTGWIEIPKQIHLGSEEENPVMGIGAGVLNGAGLPLLRAGVGIYEALTFPIPYPKDYASPYEQMEINDYAWE